MIPSVEERKKNSNVFNHCYNDACKLKNQIPLGSVKAHLLKNSLDFVGDRVKLMEWYPILQALRLDRSLHFIAIRCLDKSSVLEGVESEARAKNITKRPVLFTKYLLQKLMKSLTECLAATKVLTCIELEGFPFTVKYIEELCKGIAACESLQNVSLHRSNIGDAGVEVVCRTVKFLPRILSLDFSACGIGLRGATAVADLLRYQKLMLYGQRWEQSLRNREVEIQSVTGLKRITLNHNPKIGDKGALCLIDVISDNIWLKAVDMQNCGLGDVTAGVVLAMLQSSTWLSIVDVRSNQISMNFLKRIMIQLGKNNAQSPHEYHWLTVEQRFLPVQQTARPATAKVKLPSKSTKPTRPISQPPFDTDRVQSIPHYATPRDGPRMRSDTYGTRLMEKHIMEHPPYQSVSPIPPSPPPPSAPSKEQQTELYLQASRDLIQELSSQLHQVKELNKQLQIELKDELEKRKQAEAHIINLQEQLDAKVTGGTILDQTTIEDIQNTFASFSSFLKIIRSSGLGNQLNQEQKVSRDVAMTDDELRDRMQMVLSRSEHSPRKISARSRRGTRAAKSATTTRLPSSTEELTLYGDAGESPRIAGGDAQKNAKKRRRPLSAFYSQSTLSSGDAHSNFNVGEKGDLDCAAPRNRDSMFSETDLATEEDTY